MSWFYLILAGGISVAGPFETKEDCVAAMERNKPVLIDPDFYNPPLRLLGLCFQAEAASWSSK